MKKTYVIPQIVALTFVSENLVLCASSTSTSGGSASADDFIKNDLTGNNDFWN